MSPRLCLVEDAAATRLEPLTLTRPSFALRCGAWSLGQRIGRALGIGPGPARNGAVVRSGLAELVAEDQPHLAVNDRLWLSRGTTLMANGRWVPAEDLPAADPSEGPWVGLCQGRPALAQVGPDEAIQLEPGHIDNWFEQVASRHARREIGGHWIDHPWDLVELNGALIERDLATCGHRGVTNRHLSTIHLVGPSDRLAIHESVQIDPCVVVDTRGGPVIIEAQAQVQAFTRIEGPCVIGRQTQLFRANLRGGVTLGPQCRIGGEVEESIIQGYTNKYHEGFLGHAYLGAWVNLGAITSNSDLRNDYGPVQVPLTGEPIPTGRAKIGCFLGDHTRTGLGSLINTGTAVGVMCNLLPAGLLLPKYVPSFSAVLYGRIASSWELDKLFETARVVKGRRGLEFTPTEERFYRDLHERTRLERERLYLRAANTPTVRERVTPPSQTG